MKKVFSKELCVLWFVLAGLVWAGLSLNSSLNQLVKQEEA